MQRQSRAIKMNKDDMVADEFQEGSRQPNYEGLEKDHQEQQFSSSTSNFSRVLVSDDIDNEDLFIS